MLRSTLLLKWYVQSKIAERAALLSDELPRILSELGLPVPPMGGGFLWKFTDDQLAQMGDYPGLRRRLDYQGRLRLYMDWDVDSVRIQAQAWAADTSNDNRGHADERCVVSKVVNHREREDGGGTEFLVKWQQYDMEASWEREAVVSQCEAYTVYKTSQRGLRRSSRLSIDVAKNVD